MSRPRRSAGNPCSACRRTLPANPTAVLVYRRGAPIVRCEICEICSRRWHRSWHGQEAVKRAVRARVMAEIGEA
jgi:LSD1 subclass zinc finger protein